MKKLAKISTITIITALATGCASTSDLEMLSKRVDALDNKVSTIATNAMKAREAANEASKRANSARLAANRAAGYAQETNRKLDNMFKKSMMK